MREWVEASYGTGSEGGCHDCCRLVGRCLDIHRSVSLSESEPPLILVFIFSLVASRSCLGGAVMELIYVESSRREQRSHELKSYCVIDRRHLDYFNT